MPRLYGVTSVLSIVLFAALAVADSTNQQDGSLNTNTVDSTVDSNNVTEDHSISNTYNGAGSSSEMPVTSAIAPSYISNGIETCLRGAGGAIQTGIVGITTGRYKEDKHCNRRRDAKVLSEQGMKVAAIARMCEDIEVWRAMFVSGTPCPVLHNSKLVAGKRSYLIMKMQPELYIPDYSNKTKDWYNSMLGIGIENDEENTEDSESVSDKFRSSLK